MARLFDPIALMSAPLPENATRRDPLPIGETIAQIADISFSEGVSKPGSKNPGQPWTRLDAKLEITDADYLAMVPGNPEKVITTLGVMLEMSGNNIAYGPNKNIRLGRLREATGTNGKPLDAMVGQYIRITIGQKPHPTETNEDGSPVILDEVTGYTKV